MVLEDTDESDEEEIVGACVPCKKLNVSPLVSDDAPPCPPVAVGGGLLESSFESGFWSWL